MSTRILRQPDGRPVRAEARWVRTRPHACGKRCPLHAVPVPAPPKARRG